MQSLSATLAGGRLPARRVREPLSPQQAQYIELRCHVCAANLATIAYHALGQAHEPIGCPACFALFEQRQRIWQSLAQRRKVYFRRFVTDYETIRKAEGRGTDDPGFYLSLPFQDRTERNSWQWSIRARTYKYIERHILPVIKRHALERLSVLDLGAGNGWLSYRLANLGHRPIALDLQTNTFDGLGAATHYEHVLPTLFPRFQAELDRLPFTCGQFDCAIFNASFHYSENYDRTLAEAIRCLRPGGTIVIADTPSYSCEDAGQQMLAERRNAFQRRFGFTSDSLACCEYLTKQRLLSLETRHDIQWTTHRVWYGLRWACRPMLATLKSRREPSQFRIYTAQVKVP